MYISPRHSNSGEQDPAPDVPLQHGDTGRSDVPTPSPTLSSSAPAIPVPASSADAVMGALVTPRWNHPFSPDSPFGILERKNPGSYASRCAEHSRRMREAQTPKERAAVDAALVVAAKSGTIRRDQVSDKLMRQVEEDAADEATTLQRIDADLEGFDEPEEQSEGAPNTAEVVAGRRQAVEELFRRLDEDEEAPGKSDQTSQSATEVATSTREGISAALKKELLAFSASKGNPLTEALLATLDFGSFDRRHMRVVIRRVQYPVSHKALELLGRLSQANKALGLAEGSDDKLFPELGKAGMNTSRTQSDTEFAWGRGSRSSSGRPSRPEWGGYNRLPIMPARGQDAWLERLAEARRAARRVGPPAPEGGGTSDAQSLGAQSPDAPTPVTPVNLKQAAAGSDNGATTNGHATPSAASGLTATDRALSADVVPSGATRVEGDLSAGAASETAGLNGQARHSEESPPPSDDPKGGRSLQIPTPPDAIAS